MVRIFVEGSDDEKFIIKLLNDLRKLEQISITDRFQPIKDKLIDLFKGIK